MGKSKPTPAPATQAAKPIAQKPQPPKVVTQDPYANEPGHAIDTSNPNCTR